MTHSTELDERGQLIVDVLVDAFSDLMAADADAFRTKFRKMAADPFAFYRGSACLFYADMATLEDRWSDERTSRVWIQGDLHAENFGTYMDSAGRIVFDVNDFDEAYLGHVSWDLRRFAASFALMAWRKALSDDAIGELIGIYLRAYLDQVEAFTRSDEDRSFALVKGNTEGAVHEVILETATRTRLGLLQRLTVVEEHERRFADLPRNRRLDDDERERVMAALQRYRETVVPPRRRRDVAYDVKDVVGTGGFGIGSAGLPAYNVLLEGYDQALENDVVLSIKQGNVAAPSRIVDDPELRGYFQHEGHRTAMSQRALQANASQFLGYTEIGGVGFIVAELSPYELDLDWEDLTEPEEIAPGDGPAGQGHRQAALRRRRRQRPLARALPDGGGDHGDDRGPARGVRRGPDPVRARLRAQHPGGPPALRRRLPCRRDPGDQLERLAPGGEAR